VSQGRTTVGIILSAVYLIVAALILQENWALAKQMKPNEWGDFLAGVFAPLAFLWLVLGYFQQGDELRLNTEALKLQAEELRHQVAETKALVRESARSAEHQEAQFELLSQKALPRFEELKVQRWAANYPHEEFRTAVWIHAKNVGSTVTSLMTFVQDAEGAEAKDESVEPASMVETTKRVVFKFAFRDAAPGNFVFQVYYQDGNGIERFSEFNVAGSSCLEVVRGKLRRDQNSA
jgi:hypothetical protein